MHRLFIRLPYDKGYPHELVYGEEVSIISGRSAQLLYSSGVPYEMINEVPDASIKQRTRAFRMAMSSLSKKARKMVLNHHPVKTLVVSWKW